MTMVRALWAIIGRWYVSALLVTALGVALGSYVFFNVYPGRPQIGVIDIPFTVIDEDSAFAIGEMLDYARRTDSIKGVVIKLTTPGGGAASSEQLYLKTIRLREKKPVVISSGWLNASGGMMMSMGANQIYAEAASFVGSVGVIFTLDEPERPDELLITSGPAKLTGGSQRTFTGMMEVLKEGFLQIVTAERGNRLRMTRAELSEARIYTGSEAVRLGLIDAIGSDTDAVKKAASLAGVSSYELVDVNEKVLREFVLKVKRIFAFSDGEEPEFNISDIAALRKIASSARRDEGHPGVPPEFPGDLSLPRMYYLCVTPTPAPTATPELPAGSVEHRFDVKDFTHQSVTIKVGESILWTNRESNNVLHSVVHTTLERGEETLFSGPNMQPDESFRYTFTKPGEFRYVCRIHPVRMKAIITVVEE